MVSKPDTDSSSELIGRVQADEFRLLHLYREWTHASPAIRRSHGNKYNGDVYYGAFRGRMHLDAGTTMTVLLRSGRTERWKWDARGPVREIQNTRRRRWFGSPGQAGFTSLPYRLPWLPYAAVFFEQYITRPQVPLGATWDRAGTVAGPSGGYTPMIDTDRSGWPPTGA